MMYHYGAAIYAIKIEIWINPYCRNYTEINVAFKFNMKKQVTT